MEMERLVLAKMS
jgi:hypothetical protein